MGERNLKHVPNRSGFGIQGFILIGGASSRMGTNKAQLRLGGRTFVDRIAEALSAVADTVYCVGGKEDSCPDRSNVPDIHLEWGALGGLHGALSACTFEWAAVAACDLPFVTGHLFQRLASMRCDLDAVVPLQPDGRPQPLAALYRRGPCLAQAEALIAIGERRPRALLAAVKTRWVEHAELEDLSGSANFFSNINAPGDYARARSLTGNGKSGI